MKSHHDNQKDSLVETAGCHIAFVFMELLKRNADRQSNSRHTPECMSWFTKYIPSGMHPTPFYQQWLLRYHAPVFLLVPAGKYSCIILVYSCTWSFSCILDEDTQSKRYSQTMSNSMLPKRYWVVLIASLWVVLIAPTIVVVTSQTVASTIRLPTRTNIECVNATIIPSQVITTTNPNPIFVSLKYASKRV